MTSEGRHSRGPKDEMTRIAIPSQMKTLHSGNRSFILLPPSSGMNPASQGLRHIGFDPPTTQRNNNCIGDIVGAFMHLHTAFSNVLVE